MRRVQRVRDLNRQVKQRIRLQGLTLDTLLERLAFQQLHRDERLVCVFADLVDCADIGMIQGRCGSCLTAKSFERL